MLEDPKRENRMFEDPKTMAELLNSIFQEMFIKDGGTYICAWSGLVSLAILKSSLCQQELTFSHSSTVRCINLSFWETHHYILPYLSLANVNKIV